MDLTNGYILIMPQHNRNDSKAEAIYQAYLSGKSLEQVSFDFDVTRQSVFKMLKRRGLELRPKIELEFIVWNGEKYTVRGGYYKKTRGDRALLHREMWKHSHGLIPENYEVHHINGDRLDNRLSNFELLAKSEHTRRHQMEKRLRRSQQI